MHSAAVRILAGYIIVPGRDLAGLRPTYQGLLRTDVS